MKRYQEEWFQDKLDDINEVESHVMESKEFLDAKRQLEEIKSKIKAQVPEAERSAIDLLFDSMDEINLSVYNMLMEKIVCATKFDDFFAYNILYVIKRYKLNIVENLIISSLKNLVASKFPEWEVTFYVASRYSGKRGRLLESRL